MIEEFSHNGLIGRDGTFYPCGIAQHIQTALDNNHNSPFAIIRCHFGDVNVEFEAYYTATKDLPTQAQFETLMDYCTYYNYKFEDITDCWDLPWEKWRE